jgi:hypothetical protein
MITQEQFDALKPGDKVLVEATFVYFSVPLAGHETAAGITISSGPRYSATRHYATPASIHSVLPRAIRVGDRVRTRSGQIWEVVAPPRACKGTVRDEVSFWSEDLGYGQEYADRLEVIS